MKVHIGTDHAGFQMKEMLKPYLTDLGYDVVDHGAFEYKEGDDYPDFVKPVAEAVSNSVGPELVEGQNPTERSMGIILGASGQGEDMVADKVSGIRSAEYYGGNLEVVKLAREHNDANIISLGARFLSDEDAKQAVKLFLTTEFSGEARHLRRIEKLEPNA